MMPEADACRAILARGSKSFTLGSRLFSSRVRDDAAAVYAFCRRTDDAIDLPTAEDRTMTLQRLRDEVSAIYAGTAQHDIVLSAFQKVTLRRGIPAEYPRELLAGMEMDVEGHRYESMRSLLLYCYRVAGTVGLMMSHVMGVSHVHALRHAAHLGMGMQLTNICRDVREDWQLGRLYIPADLLRDVGAGWLCELVGRGHPLPVEARAPLGRALRRLLAEADVFYRSGDTGLSALSFRCELAVRTARLVYAAIGDTIAQSRHNVFAARAVVPAGTKLVLAGVACAGAAASLPMRLDRPFREARLVAPLRFPDDILVFSNEPTDATP